MVSRWGCAPSVTHWTSLGFSSLATFYPDTFNGDIITYHHYTHKPIHPLLFVFWETEYHLPVRDRGKICGVLSDSEVAAPRALPLGAPLVVHFAGATGVERLGM